MEAKIDKGLSDRTRFLEADGRCYRISLRYSGNFLR